MSTLALALQIAQAALLAAVFVAILLRKRDHTGIASKKDEPEVKSVIRAIVRAAVAERLEHEAERPDRYPKDQRISSILQRARRRMHHDQIAEPPEEELLALIADQVRKLQ